MAVETVTLPVIELDRKPAGDVSVPAAVVAGPVREHLLYEAVLSQRAARRAGTHSTKTRAFVSGGGKKPWKQKGTGRARAGSTRSPLWPGGAVVFGPLPRDYSYRIPRSARGAALRSARAARHGEGKLLVVAEFSLPQAKTKSLVHTLGELGLEGSVLVVIEKADIGLERAARNLPQVKVLRCEALNVYDILDHAQLVITRSALEQIVTRLGGGAEART